MDRTRTALITGASRGIGRGIALALAQAGYRIGIHYARNLSAAQQTADQVCALGGQALVLPADLADPAAVQQLAEHAVEQLGRIDLLVNNAGIAPTQRNDVLDMTPDSWNQLLATNLTGPMFLSQTLIKTILDQNPDQGVRGRVVFVTSISAYVASINRAEYCVSKAGLSMAARVLAVRLARSQIPVFEIQPGLIATDMTAGVREKYDQLIADGLVPQGRWGTPDDVARVVLAIAEGRLDFCTGQVIGPDGGFGLPRL